MDVAAIADPRTFAQAQDAASGDAALYETAQRALDAPTARERDALDAGLRDAIAAKVRDDGAALGALFDGAPSVDVARALWRALDAVWRDAIANDGDVGITIFALPIVIVAAGTGTGSGVLAASIRDTAPLDALLREHRALRGSETQALANALVAPDALDIARLPQLLTWHRVDLLGRGMRELAPAPLHYAAGRESVHARLAVGSALAARGVDLLDREPDRGWAMPFTRELVRQLAAPEASVLALPSAPAHPLLAVRRARASQREIAAQVFVSNALRAIRSRSGEAVAIVSAHRAADAPGGGELRLSLSSPFEPRDAEGFRCPLYSIDRAADVARMLVALLRDCRVADVRVIAGIHGEYVTGTAQRLLFKPETLPTDARTLH